MRILLDENLLSRKLKQPTRPDWLIPLILKVIPLLTTLETGSVTIINEVDNR